MWYVPLRPSRHHHVFYLFSALLVALNSSAVAAEAKPQAAGEIVSVDGTVFIRSDQKQETQARADKVQKVRPAAVGDSVYVQDVVNTASNGRIKILMTDKSIVDLGPSALFKVDRFDKKSGTGDREVEVSMVYGTMRAAISQKITGKGKFKVRTPSATMGVRGTEFVVKSEVRDMKDVNRMLNNSTQTLPPANFGITPSTNASANATTEITVLQGKVDVAKKDFDASANAPGRNAAVSAQPGGAPPGNVVSLTAGSQLVSRQNEGAISKPLTISNQQMATLSTSTKISDSTFQKAVVIDSSGQTASNNQGSGGSEKGDGSRRPAGEGEKAPLTLLPPPPPPPTLTATDMGVPGTFQPTQILTDKPVIQQGTTKRLRVTVVTQ